MADTSAHNKEMCIRDRIADYLIFNMKNNGAYEVKDPEIIEKMVDLVTKDRKKPAVNFVGKDVYKRQLVTDALSQYNIVAGRGNIRGCEGPRNAVATGLALSLIRI